MKPKIICTRNPAPAFRAASNSALCIARALAVEPEVLADG